MAQMVKNLPAVWETRVQSLGQEDPLEKEMATHYSILAWEIPWAEEPGGLQSMGSKIVRHSWATKSAGECPQSARQFAWRFVAMVTLIHVQFCFSP